MVQSFKDGSWSARFAAMGDESEAQFELLFPHFHRSGLNRPNLSVAQLDVKERNTPDYLCADAYVECMGIGGKQPSLKLKIEKAIALCLWDHDKHTDLFVWDSTRRRWWRAPIWAWIEACVRHGEVHQFPDNDKSYWQLKPADFPAAANKIEDPA